MHFVVAGFWSAPRPLSRRSVCHAPRSRRSAGKDRPLPDIAPIAAGPTLDLRPLYGHETANDPLTPKKRA